VAVQQLLEGCVVQRGEIKEENEGAGGARNGRQVRACDCNRPSQYIFSTSIYFRDSMEILVKRKRR
jgi:hypothetical protein